MLYGLPRVGLMAVSVIMIPVYTRYFAVAEYGIIENLSILSVLLTLAFGLALPDGVTRFYAVAGSDEERARILSTATLATIGLGVLVIAATIAAAGWLGPALLHDASERHPRLLVLVPIAVALNLSLGLLQTALLMRFRRRDYLVTSLGAVAVSPAVIALCVVGAGLGVEGVFIGPVVGSGIMVAYAFARLRDDLRPSAFSGATLRRLLAFGLPIVPVGLAFLVMRASDRYFITALMTDPFHQIGLYSAAEKVLGPLTLIGAAFSVAWGPFAMAASKQPDAKILYARTFRLYVAVATVAAVALCAAAPLLLRILTTPPFYPAAAYTPPLAVYLALNVLHYVGSIGLVLTNRTSAMVPPVLVAALVNAGLNAVLIPVWGVRGAAWATVVSFAAYNVMIYRAAERVYPIGYPVGRAFIVYTTAAVAAHVAIQGMLLGIAMVVAQLGVVLAAGFLNVGPLRERYRQLMDARGASNA